MGEVMQLCIDDEAHDLEIWGYPCDDQGNTYGVMGYCKKCGYTVELSKKYFEEMFNE